jgi:Rrf2 family protein
MQLTRAADYAVRVMIHLASQPEGAVVSKTLLAQEAEAPESFLSKILQTLARSGLIQARRGVEGGFVLLPRGAGSSLLDVVESVDGPIALNLCLNADAACSRQPGCVVHQVWVRAQAAMVAVLREAKIAEMSRAGQGCAMRSTNQLAQRNNLESKHLSPTKTARPHAVPVGLQRTASNKPK